MKDSGIGELSQSRTLNPTFFNKVLSIFALSIFTTGIGTYVGFRFLNIIFLSNPFLMWGLFIAELILIFSSRAWSKIEPLNYFLFFTFTLLSGITIVPLLSSFIVEFKGFDIIYRALFATTATYIAMALIGLNTKRSLAGMSGFLFIGLIGLLIVGIMGIFLPWGNTGEMIYSFFGVLLFAGYTMYNINTLKYYAEDEYINAAIQLYLDFFNLFIYVLRLTGALSRD